MLLHTYQWQHFTNSNLSNKQAEGWIGKAKGLWEQPWKNSGSLDDFRIEDQNFAGFQHF